MAVGPHGNFRKNILKSLFCLCIINPRAISSTVEQAPLKRKVTGSNPVWPTFLKNGNR